MKYESRDSTQDPHPQGPVFSYLLPSGIQEPMTLRDWFAGLAMNNLLEEGYPYRENIEEAYKIADLMMEERRK